MVCRHSEKIVMMLQRTEMEVEHTIEVCLDISNTIFKSNWLKAATTVIQGHTLIKKLM